MFVKIIISSFLFFFSIIVIGQDLDKPFWGEHDWNGVRYGQIARNFIRYGLIETKLGQVENSGIVTKDQFEYYTHYPLLLPILIALSYNIFGTGEWTTRLLPLLATSGSLVLIFLIGSKLYYVRVGILASLISLATPMVLYFGKNPAHEPLTLFLILLAFYGYISSNKTLFVLVLVLAQISAWAGYFLIPAITIISILRRDFKSVKKLIPFWFLSFGMFLVHLIHINLLTGSISGGDLFGALSQRSGISQILQPEGFSIINYLGRIRLWFSTLYTNTLLLFVFVWLISKKFTKIKDSDRYIFSLCFVGLIYSVVFSSAVFVHNYLIFYFLPFLTITAVLGIELLFGRKSFGKIYPIIALLIIFIVAMERRDFLMALARSRIDEFAVRVGKSIREQTKDEDVILISPAKFSYTADKFLRFYSDRKLIYSDDDKVNFDVKVLVDQDLGKFEIIKK